jgi:hypothetical protein
LTLQEIKIRAIGAAVLKRRLILIRLRLMPWRLARARRLSAQKLDA